MLRPLCFLSSFVEVQFANKVQVSKVQLVLPICVFIGIFMVVNELMSLFTCLLGCHWMVIAAMLSNVFSTIFPGWALLVEENIEVDLTPDSGHELFY